MPRECEPGGVVSAASIPIVAVVSLAMTVSACAVCASPPPEHHVAPGDDPQAAVDRAAPGDRVVLLPGLHERPLGRHRSLIFIDKSLDLEISAGATLRLAAGQTALEPDPEITTDHSAKAIDDLEVGGTYDLSQGPLLLTITIDGTGGGPDDGDADTFSWARGVFGKPAAAHMPITGDWQPLDHGITVRFSSRRGHNRGAFWFVSYDGPASYGVRVGVGVQAEPVTDVRIGGRGTIDMASGANAQPSEMVRDISACVLVHGRVRGVLVEELTLANSMRSVMVYGEHTGAFLPGGGTRGGTSFDAASISILGTRTINPGTAGYPFGAAYLLGHPSHRGQLTDVRCNFNLMESVTTSLEPNFNLSRYEVVGNLITSRGEAVHCWRRSTDGIVVDNVRLDDTAGRPVVRDNSPSGWARSERLRFGGNINLVSDPIESFGTFAPLPDGHAILGGTTAGGAHSRLDLLAGPAPRLPTDGTGRLRGIVVARSDDGRVHAAFQVTSRVAMTGNGPTLDDVVVRPAGGAPDGFGVELDEAADDAPGGPATPLVRVGVRGSGDATVRWRCHLAIDD